MDADFAGGFDLGLSHIRSSVLSRTGYIIFLSGCPILWVSKLQTEVALSTTEVEYIALSQSMRDLLPLHEILKELAQILDLKIVVKVTRLTVFEDNNEALELARQPKYRPRTKHIAIKYHHFRDHVLNGSVRIMAIDTKDQRADITTKPKEKQSFEHLRFKISGW